MNTSFPRACLVLSLILFVTGFFVLCDCPAWYPAAAILAAPAVLFGEKQMRFWGIVFLSASLVIVGFQGYEKLQERRKLRELRQRVEAELLRHRAMPVPTPQLQPP